MDNKIPLGLSSLMEEITKRQFSLFVEWTIRKNVMRELRMEMNNEEDLTGVSGLGSV